MTERALHDEKEQWITIERPGYLGSRKDDEIARWNSEYGHGNWRLVWGLENGETFDFDDMFWKIYVPGYVGYFLSHKDEATDVTTNFAYGFDKDLCSRQEAFDPHALNDVPGKPNQFHHVSFNIALEWYLGLPFRGTNPVQVREGKPGTPEEEQPAGWRFSPGRIPLIRQDLWPSQPKVGWWQPGSIEGLYQSAKVLQIHV